MKHVSLNDLKPGYEIVIVGAGAAGCSLAYHLNDSSNALLIDYRKFPRFKACSGILVHAAKEHFDGIQIPNEVFSNPKEIDFVYADWNNNVEKPIKKGFFNTYRENLDKWLFNRLKTKKIEFCEKAKLIDFSYTKDKKHIVLMIESEGNIKNIVTKYLIGCDGATSMIRKKISTTQIPYYLAIQEVIPQEKVSPKTYFIYDDEITDFYSWVIPKNKSIEIGSAVKPENSKETFELFKRKVKEKLGIEGNGKMEAAIILRPDSFSEIVLGNENIILCGEAAGLISPSSAEGISYALVSGKKCAEAINSCLEKGKNEVLETYKHNIKQLLERLKKKFDKSEQIKKHSTRKGFFE